MISYLYDVNVQDIITCGETASECLPYASTAPNILQNPAFLNSRDWLLKCDYDIICTFHMKCTDDIIVMLNDVI
jgi:hypothetical protein